MTAIYSLAPVSESSNILTNINTNVDGLEAAIGTTTDVANATGSLLARLGAIATFVDGLEGFTDGIEGTLGTATVTPAANTINANLVRLIRAAGASSLVITPPTTGSVPISTGTAASLVTGTSAVDWRRVKIFNPTSNPTVLIALGGNATQSLYSYPLPPGHMAIEETLGSITALSTGSACNVLITVES